MVRPRQRVVGAVAAVVVVEVAAEVAAEVVVAAVPPIRQPETRRSPAPTARARRGSRPRSPIAAIDTDSRSCPIPPFGVMLLPHGGVVQPGQFAAATAQARTRRSAPHSIFYSANRCATALHQLVVAVDGPKGRFTAPANTLPATHWNRRMLDGPFLNTQTGAVQKPKIVRKGEATIPSRADPIRAEHFAMTGELELDTCYDDGPTRAGLRFKGGDGSIIGYERA